MIADPWGTQEVQPESKILPKEVQDVAEPEPEYESAGETERVPPVRGRPHRRRHGRRSAGSSSSTRMYAIAGGLFLLAIILAIVLKFR